MLLDHGADIHDDDVSKTDIDEIITRSIRVPSMANISN